MPDPEQSKSHLPWSVRVGRRVVLRHRLDSAEPSGALFTDVTGDLIAADATHATVRSRTDEVVVAWADVVAAKELPPRASRPGRPHRTIDIEDLQRLMVDGLPGLFQLPIGDWLCRTAEGYTGRANSALTVGDPGLPLPDAVAEVAAAYARLGQPALFQLAVETASDPAQHPVAAELLRRGGSLFQRTLVMTAATREVALATAAPQTAVEVSPAPPDAWWVASSPRSVEHRDIVERLIEQVHDGWFLTALQPGGDPVAVARIAYSPGWVGLYDLHTPPAARGHGYARTLVGEAARDADRRGVRSAYLQVSADNEPAIALYESLGYTTHHEYWYARP
ncbi:GNAT family N-acetyltransferase [Calidifontibacter terrae]